MTSIIFGRLFHQYQHLLENRSDSRSKDWLLMSSPWPTMILCLGYIILSKWLGPRFMKDRKPYDLRSIIVLYNGIQVLFSAWLFYELGQGGWFHNYSFFCQPVDYSNSLMATRMVNASWWYFLSKFTEFIDTFFFILRGKIDHVSNLHVIHHGIMPLCVWLGLKFTPGGHSSFMAICNTFVHILMYFYYMVTAMGPKYSKFIWWKRYLTNIQIIQFVIVFLHAFQLLFRECNYPKVFVWLIGFHSLMFLGLFLNFHKKTYKRPIQHQKENFQVVNNDFMKHEHNIKTIKTRQGREILIKITSRLKDLVFNLKKHI